MEKSTEIHKNGYYMILKGLEKGLGMIVLETGNTICGIKIHIGKSEKFSMTKDAFEKLLAYDMLEFVEVLPKFVIKDFKKIYNK